MESIKFKLEVECEISAENISDLLVTAFEGGINYWCGGVEIRDVLEDSIDDVNYASDVLTNGGWLLLHDAESNDTWKLTLDKFISGVKQYMLGHGCNSVEELMDNQDAEVADMIIQFALFNDIVFG